MTITLFLVRLYIKINLQLHDQKSVFFAQKSGDLFFSIMYLLIISKKIIIQIYSTITPKFSTFFGIIRGTRKPFSLNSLRQFQLLQIHILFFFRGLYRGAFRVFRSFFRILYATSSLFFVPLPGTVVNINPKYLETPKGGNLVPFSFSNNCQCIPRLDAGNDEFIE